MFSLQQIYSWLQEAGLACTLNADGLVQAERIHTDTRTVQKGDLFLALKGETFDANDFLPQAKAAGAVCAIANRGLLDAGLPGIEVADTKAALGVIAKCWRAQFAIPLIAVAGSNGKTTVTQMIYSILRDYAGADALSTQGNLNNDIGVPLTLLRLRSHHRIAVVELGMNHPGEIAYLSSLASPTVALVNNAQREHQEFMHTVEAVAVENGSVFSSLQPDGIAIYPGDDAFTPIWDRLTLHCQRVRLNPLTNNGSARTNSDYSFSCQWQAQAWQIQVQQSQHEAQFMLKMPGLHNVRNAVMAYIAAQCVGVESKHIFAGLLKFEPVNGRSRLHRLQTLNEQEILLVDDSYNANPDSVCAAIDMLSQLPAPHLLVLGDMGEIGANGDELHAEVGEYAAQRGIENLFCIGELTRYTAAAFPGARHFASMESLQKACIEIFDQHRSILIKASRFMTMEKLVHSILQDKRVKQEGAYAA